ncbi:MAG: caspase family protein [Planktothrix sp.]
MKRQALVIGINRYPFLKESPTSKAQHLTTAAADAEAIAQLLEKPSGELAWSVRRLPEVAQGGTFRVADMARVSEDELSIEISELLHPEPHHVPDVALLFFAGHGLRKKQDSQTEGFLATSDANARTKWGISLTWLRRQLLSSPVKQQVVWLDCCHSGELLNFLTEDELRSWLSGGDRLLIAACRRDRQAYALGDHGVLTEVLLQGLDPAQHPSGQWISSWTLTRFFRQKLETISVLKRQIPISRHFGEEICFWQGTKAPKISEEKHRVSLESETYSYQQSYKLSIDLGFCDIRVIGPRASGKTTFLATLSYALSLYNAHTIRAIAPLTEETHDLMNKAEFILGQGLQLEPTDWKMDDSEPYYSFLITLKPSFCSHPKACLMNQDVHFSLSCKDYSGELIENLQKVRSQEIFFDNFLNDCALASGLLVIIDTNESDFDKKYAYYFNIFQKEICFRLRKGDRNLKRYRIAIVFSKFDQSEMWNSRNQLQKFIYLKFPRTQNVFNNWCKNWGITVNYFACSAFGMFGEPPRPNVIGESYGYLANLEQWKPFGLIAPIYWLCTGKTDFWSRDI